MNYYSGKGLKKRELSKLCKILSFLDKWLNSRYVTHFWIKKYIQIYIFFYFFVFLFFCFFIFCFFIFLVVYVVCVLFMWVCAYMCVCVCVCVYYLWCDDGECAVKLLLDV